jgi:hypothetical protein
MAAWRLLGKTQNSQVNVLDLVKVIMEADLQLVL